MPTGQAYDVKMGTAYTAAPVTGIWKDDNRLLRDSGIQISRS